MTILLEFIVGFMLVGLVLVGLLSLLGVKVLKGGQSRPSGDSDDETRMIQEIYQGMSRLEERIESLETILLDREKKEGS